MSVDEELTFGPNTRLTDTRLWPPSVESERTPPAWNTADSLRDGIPPRSEFTILPVLGSTL